MKKCELEMPTIEYMEFDHKDIIVTSGCGGEHWDSKDDGSDYAEGDQDSAMARPDF